MHVYVCYGKLIKFNYTEFYKLDAITHICGYFSCIVMKR